MRGSGNLDLKFIAFSYGRSREDSTFGLLTTLGALDWIEFIQYVVDYLKMVCFVKWGI